MAPHSSTFAWKIPWTEEPGRLQSMGSQRVGRRADWVNDGDLKNEKALISPGFLTDLIRRRRDLNQEDPSECTIKQGFVTSLFWKSHHFWKDIQALRGYIDPPLPESFANLRSGFESSYG